MTTNLATQAPREVSLGDQITQLSAHISAATYQLLNLIGEFDAKELWREPGLKSMAHGLIRYERALLR